jgi:acyl-CoA synthetase
VAVSGELESFPGGWNTHAGREQAYIDAGYWRPDTLVDVIRGHAATQPNGVAYYDGDVPWSWSVVDEASDALAGALLEAGLERGAPIAVLLPDGAAVHIGFLAAEKAGLVAVGIGARSGLAEIAHLVGKTRARVVLSGAVHDGGPAPALVDALRAQGLTIEHHLIVDDDLQGVSIDGSRRTSTGATADRRADIDARRFGPNELSFINSTSGTTGMPKCVMHNQNRWWYFHLLANRAANFTGDDVFFSAVPMPFGFGLWTSHFSPAYLGVPVGTMQRFSPRTMIASIEKQRTTVLACVSTQFIMMLNRAESAEHDLSSLRVLFTGGEAVPYERAAEFEDRFGCTVLQFYGSNETGALSYTSLTDSRQVRLTTAGRLIPEMDVIMVDAARQRVPLHGTSAQPACKGPATALGYFDDEKANHELFTDDGWMLMGDIVEIDEDDCLRVVGRVADFIIRGGKNISAPSVEAEVATHPAIDLVAAVPDPDPVLGERVGLYVTLKPDMELTLEELVEHLRARGMSKDYLPERMTVVDEMPMAPGGKIAKGLLRKQAAA